MPRQEDFQLRHGTAAQWTAANPVLDEGEIGVELDTHLIKAGDGTTTWNLLPYAGNGTAFGVETLQGVGQLTYNGFTTTYS